MQFLFVADLLETFNIKKDTTFAMMREAQKRGHVIWATHPKDISWKAGGKVQAQARHICLVDDAAAPLWFQQVKTEQRSIADFDAVLMRKDPPFDSEFFYATHMLSQAQRDGAKVFNNPAALREHPEKMAVMEFPDVLGPTAITRNPEDIRAFHVEHKDIILKPLDGMGGMGIFRVKEDGLNLGSIMETLNRNGAVSVMVQKFLPEIAQGDKRVLIIGGKPVPFCLARIPQNGEVRGNLAAGGKGVAQPLSAADEKIAQRLGPVLVERGLLLVGLDVIGDKVTEINVTSPTGFQEIHKQTGCDVASLFIDALEAAVRGHEC